MLFRFGEMFSDGLASQFDVGAAKVGVISR